ncbi:AMP-binding protein [Frateuria defendens]|uniref:AMP-binding protein n=1 Tax=Frateuria defendens TaxID=2219559 RepID=UPI00066FBB1C|nr:AMP-binding protein [Frateuria defendens]
MAIVYDTYQHEAPARLPLLHAPDPTRVLAWRAGRAVGVAEFLAHVRAVAAALPAAGAAVNLCEDRYAFLVAFCALALRGQANLLPPSRAPQAVAEVMAAHPGCYALGERALTAAPPGYQRLPPLDEMAPAAVGDWPQLPAGQVVAVNYTSGSTGKPRANVKTWRALHADTAGNRAMLQAVLGARFELVATVPPQHMYGMETSVLLPLLSDVGVHAGQPFFPADVAAALAEVPAPRLLVTTPVHLRALLAAEVALPPLAAVLSATAPLPVELAQAAEARYGAPVREIFGSTETGAIASRRTATEEAWTPYAGVALHPQPDGTLVEAPQLAAPLVLADLASLADDGRFRLRGRQADLLEIAGKRASLGDLTRRLLAVPGVRDGVVVQLDEADAMGVRRIAALAVAPGLDEHAILAALRGAMDPVFLPRPLKLVEALPRNETGKLPRAALLALLGGRA